jgi:outer membrane protein
MSRLILSILFATLWIPLLGMAQTSQTPATQTPAVVGPAKIGWMNLDKAFMTCDEGKAIVADIQRYMKDKQDELDRLQSESQRLKSQLDVQGSKLTDEAQAELQAQVESKETAVQRFQQDIQKELDSKKLKMQQYLAKRMQPIIEKMAKEKGISAVLVYDPRRDAWVDPSMDVTDDIVKAYNQAYPPAAAKAPAAPATSTPPAPKKP